MKLAIGLLALVFSVHFGCDWIGSRYASHEAATKAWFYILRGIEGVALFAAIACLQRSRAVIAVCALGMFEEGMTAACRASLPIAEVPGVSSFSGLCGDDWYRFGLLMQGLVALGIVYELGRSRGKD